MSKNKERTPEKRLLKGASLVAIGAVALGGLGAYDNLKDKEIDSLSNRLNATATEIADLAVNSIDNRDTCVVEGDKSCFISTQVPTETGVSRFTIEYDPETHQISTLVGDEQSSSDGTIKSTSGVNATFNMPATMFSPGDTLDASTVSNALKTAEPATILSSQTFKSDSGSHTDIHSVKFEDGQWKYIDPLTNPMERNPGEYGYESTVDQLLEDIASTTSRVS